MDIQTIIFIGPQGSGKGTQIAKLDAVLREKDATRTVVDFQTGRRFRALGIRSEGYTEKKVSEALDNGALQPLFLSIVLWGDALREHMTPECHTLIDGFPRTVAEAEVLETALVYYERQQVIVINLETPEEIVRGRMIARSRSDDTKDSIEERLRWYREDTIPVLEYYRKRESTQVFDIDGTQSIENVHEQILSALKIA